MTIKVIQWATGEVGRAQLREIIQNPQLELVGVLVYDPAKSGMDAGDICGLAKTGITATSEKAEIFALDADVVCHAATKYGEINTNADDIETLLASGKNVVTTTTYNHLPTYGGGVQERFERACEQGGTTFMAAGEVPGFMMQRLATTLTGLTKRLDRIVLQEYFLTDWMTSASMVFDGMMMGKPPETVTLDAPAHAINDIQYKQELGATAQVLGIQLEKIERHIEVATVDYDIVIPAGTLPAGTVVGQKLTWDGYWQGRSFLTIQEYWLMTRDIPQWELSDLPAWKHNDYWRIILEGLPRIELDLNLSMGDAPGADDENSPAHLMIGMTGVRAIPEVFRAAPGVLQAPVFGAIQPE